MNDQVILLEPIKAHAREAAERGAGPEACPYIVGSDAEYHWKDTFYIRVSQLLKREAA